ncbi:MAG: PAS domain S-box protein [Desulfuromonadaceae bacterium]|nr:PAS domain S-box protein [Desulfuromonadaceae bacterium]
MLLDLDKLLLRSIRNKIALATFITISIVLLIVSSTLFLYFHNTLRESIFQQQFTLVSEIAEQMNGRIELARNQLSLVSTSINRAVLVDKTRMEREILSASPAGLIFDAGFLVIGTDGQVISESMGFPELIGTDLSLREYVRRTLATGKPVISVPFQLSIPPNPPMIAMVLPVRDDGDRIICLLAGYHTLGNDDFLTRLSSKRIGAGGYLFLIQGRTYLTHPDSSRILEEIPEGKNRGIDSALQGFEGSLDNVNSKGQHMLSSYKRVGDSGWILGANIPYDEAFAPLKKLAITASIIASVGILFSLVVLWYVARRVALPITVLSSHLTSIGTDKREWQPLTISTGDEIELLSEAFNTMMKEVQDSKQLLQDEKNFFGGIIQNAAAPMFVIDQTHTIIFWNSALATLTGKSSFQMVGTKQQWTPFYPEKRPVLADLVIDHASVRIDELYACHSSSQFISGSQRAEGWYDNLGGKRRYIFFEAAPIKNKNNEIVAAIETLEDITDRKLAEEATASHNMFLQAVMDAIPNPVYYKDLKGVYLGCNSAFKSFFEKSAEEIIGRTLLDIMQEDYAGQSIQNDLSVIESGSGVQYETELVRGDGLIRRTLVSKAPFTHTDGSMAGIVGAFVDVTAQQEMDEKIRKMSRAIEQSPATIVITNINGIIEYVNPKFCQTTGYTADEAIGQNPRVLKSGEMPVEGYIELWQTVSSGREWRGEFHNKRKNGELYWEYASISPLIDKDGRITGYLAVKEDITGRKLVEAELKQSRLELEQLFEQVEYAKQEWEETLDHLRDYIILTDKDHCIKRCNKLLAEDTGRPVSELLGRNWMELIGEAGFTFVTFNGTTGEIYNKRAERSYDVNVSPINVPGKLPGHVVSINDTTELRSAGQELEKAFSELKDAQLQIFQQEKMASIGQLAAGVAHEINNPMGFISSNLSTLNKYVDRLAEFIAAGDELLISSAGSEGAEKITATRKRLKIDYVMEDSRQLIAESQDGAARVRRIVQDLKSFSRVDLAECALINLNEALDTTINIAWNEIKYVATLNREFGDIPQIKCFPQQINQVFLNLLVNAAHAIGENQGSITVRTWSEGDSVLVSVTDNGCGIPAEIRQKIFEPFFTTKEVGKGTGLGLSISYDIVRKHGGEITVESEIGEGTTFIVKLPVEPPAGGETA